MLLVNKNNRLDHVSDLAEMHNLRKRIFVDKRQWPCNVVNEMEFDQFDNDDAQYLIYKQNNKVIASARLIPTTSSYIVGDIFPQCFKTQEIPREKDVWEITRFCADPIKAPRNITAILLAGIMEFALENNIKYYVSIGDIRIERLIDRAGWGTERLGDTIDTGTEIAVGLKFIVNEFNYKKLFKNSLVNSPMVIQNWNMMHEPYKDVA